MAEGAKVNSLDALKHFKTYLWKFAESANLALADAESEMQRMLLWLETEQYTYWQTQIRKRTEILSRARNCSATSSFTKAPPEAANPPSKKRRPFRLALGACRRPRKNFRT